MQQHAFFCKVFPLLGGRTKTNCMRQGWVVRTHTNVKWVQTKAMILGSFLFLSLKQFSNELQEQMKLLPSFIVSNRLVKTNFIIDHFFYFS